MPESQLEIDNREGYDALAPFYERHWGTAFFSSATMLFREFLSKRIGRGSRVLDLCCGTGDFAEWLAGQGMAVTGIDNSARMLSCARAKLPETQFYEADMRSFRLTQRFDAATCFYNSINQALTLASLKQSLSTVREHLAVGGWFLFDVIQEHGYVEFWHADDLVKQDGRRCELHYRYDKIQGLALCHASICSAAGEPTQEYTLYQRPIDEQTVRHELHCAGFCVESVATVRNAIPRRGRLAVLARAVERLKVSDPHYDQP